MVRIRRETLHSRDHEVDNLTSMLRTMKQNTMHPNVQFNTFQFTCTFLLWYFIQIYSLEIVLQIYVLVHSFATYGTDHDEPYRIIYMDIVLTLLLFIELRAHYVSVPPALFWADDYYKMDMMVTVISFLFILLYILHHEQVIKVPEDSAEMLHCIRDVTRSLRLPTFIRNFKGMFIMLKGPSEHQFECMESL